MVDAAPLSTFELGGPGLRTFVNIATLWSLDDEEQMRMLGAPDHATLEEWRVRALAREPLVLAEGTLERLGAVFSIYRLLHDLLPSDEVRARWLRAPNTAAAFQGRSAMDRMIETDVRGLLVVLQYLRGQVHG